MPISCSEFCYFDSTKIYSKAQIPSIFSLYYVILNLWLLNHILKMVFHLDFFLLAWFAVHSNWSDHIFCWFFFLFIIHCQLNYPSEDCLFRYHFFKSNIYEKTFNLRNMFLCRLFWFFIKLLHNFLIFKFISA